MCSIRTECPSAALLRVPPTESSRRFSRYLRFRVKLLVTVAPFVSFTVVTVGW